MATHVTFGDLLVTVAVGKACVDTQQDYIAAQSRRLAKPGGKVDDFGRAYHSTTDTTTLEQFPILSALRSAAKIAAKPFRTIATIGDYDAARTR